MSALPPGSRLPSIVQMLEWVLRPIPFLERNTKRYGDCFTVRFVMGNVVFIANPELIKQVFTGDPDVLHAGEGNATPLEPLVGQHSVLVLDGPEHMRQRKLMLPSFHGDRMQSYRDLLLDITDTEIDRWPVGRPFALRPRTQAITLEVIMRAVFGIEDADRLEQLRDRLSGLLDSGMSRLTLAGIALPPIRRTIGRRVWSRFESLRTDVDEVLYDEIRRRRADPSTPDRDDVLSVLLQARDEGGEPMTDVELRDELMTLLAAGHETTATALAFAFDLLVHNPEAMARLRAEIEQGESEEYLDAVIKETLRLRPVLPGVIRRLTRPMELNGYQLPAGTSLAPNIYLTHRLPDVYPEPDRFLPERFLETPAGTYTWIPFGGGIRRCLGASFALFELKVVIPAVLARVRLAAAGPGPEPIRRRAITFAPAHGARVVAEEIRDRSAAGAGRAPVAA